MYMRERSSLENEKFSGGGRRRRTPSFSSSLLDSIYRSIDESNGGDGDARCVRDSNKKQNCSASKREETRGGSGKTKNNLRRAMMIENWIERQSVHSSMFTNSASSSSESSSGAAFSSSDQTESSYKRRSKQSPAVVVKPKSESESGAGGGFTKTKLRALKLYGELKKAKQPISPGGKIASFINSIFNSGNVKKAKMCYVGAVEDVSTSEHVAKSTYTSSSASTYSRSCLSKPSSRSKKSSNGNKRTVRFYPISVILGEDEHSQIPSHKCVYEQDPSLMPKPTFQKYTRTSGQDFRRSSFCEDGDDDDESDAESYSSSDLFELKLPVGIGRYTEELPVYETTNFRTNQAIAKGLIL